MNTILAARMLTMAHGTSIMLILAMIPFCIAAIALYALTISLFRKELLDQLNALRSSTKRS
jgi:ABC-type maltose transport system permease subunit